MSARNAWLKIKTCLHARKTEERERESEREGEERGRERGAGPGRESKKEKRHGSMCCSGPASCGEGPVSTAKKEEKKRNPSRPQEEKEEEEGEGRRERTKKHRNPKTAKQRTPTIICKYPYKNAPPRPNKNTSNISSGARVPKPFRKTRRNKNRAPKNKAKTGRTFLRHFRGPKTMAFQG